MSLYYKEIKSPVGKLKLVADESALIAILWESDGPARVRLNGAPKPGHEHAVLSAAEEQLGEYFAGKRESFDLPLAPLGTEFQKKVWKALRRIPFGKTWSYRELAVAIGSPKASRAVGAANGRNPLSIVVPCHRVIGADGSLTGFAAGVEVKAKLIELERRPRLRWLSS